MKIKISKYNQKLKRTDKQLYQADLKDLPGIPPIGIGKTKREAVASLFYIILVDRVDWIKSIDLESFEIVEE